MTMFCDYEFDLTTLAKSLFATEQEIADQVCHLANSLWYEQEHALTSLWLSPQYASLRARCLARAKRMVKNSNEVGFGLRSFPRVEP